MRDSIYKIFRPDEWQNFQRDGSFAGSVHDVRDGFIHLCAASQLAGTLAKHFKDVPEVILARFRSDQCAGLKWEVSRGGEEFPHIYGALNQSALQNHLILKADTRGMFQIQSDFLGTQ